jgi:hypothetical protein
MAYYQAPYAEPRATAAGYHTEERDSEGMPYGGMPPEALLLKMEVTDPGLAYGLMGPRAAALAAAPADAYHDYVRGEIVDWGADEPYLESDAPRRNPATSRGVLNLRDHGTRANTSAAPRHPELFVGFTGNDPRGAENNPRLDLYRGHVAARAAFLEPQLGNNDDNALAERPWTGSEIARGMQHLFRERKKHTKIFSVSREGGAPHQRGVVRPGERAEVRGEVLGVGGEGVRGADGYDDSDRAALGRGLAAAGYDPARARGDASGDFSVQRYGAAAGTGNGALGAGRPERSAADADWAAAQLSGATSRVRVAGAAARAAAAAARAGGGDADHGETFTAGAAGAGLAPGRDVVAALRHAGEGAARRLAMSDGVGGAAAGAGLAPGHGHLRSREAAVTPNGHLTNVAAIALGVREGTASGRRRAAGAGLAEGARVVVPDGDGRRGLGLAPGRDVGAVALLGALSHSRVVAADLAVAQYGVRAPSAAGAGLAGRAGATGYDARTWAASDANAAIGLHGALGPRSAAGEGGADTTLGVAADETFGRADAVAAGGAGAPGRKRLRAGPHLQGSELNDSPVEAF